MRVLLVNDLALDEGGGAEIYLATTAAALQLAGDDVHLLAGEVVHRGWRRALDVWDPAAARLVRRRADEVGADLVHHHNVVRELSVATVVATRHLPTVLTLHDHLLVGRGDEPDVGVRGLVRRYVKRPLDRLVVRRCVDAVVAVSEDLATAARAAGLPDVRVLPQPVPAPPGEVGPAGDADHVLFVGRLSEDKGADLVADLADRLAAARPGVVVELVGDGPLLGRLTARASDRLVVHGRLDAAGVGAAYRRARVVVVPSRPGVRREGGSLVAIEAARHRRPVVVGADPAVREVSEPLGHATVTDGTLTAVATAVLALLDDPDHATARGDAGATAASRHDPAAVAAALRALHAEVVDRHRSGPRRPPRTSG